MIASPLSIVHQTSGLLFIDKPPGLSFHASAEGDPGVLPLLREQIDDERLYSVHRLDRVTSGLLMIARSAEAASAVGTLLREHRIHKYYVALSARKPKKKMGSIVGDMERSRRGSWKLLRSTERPAATSFITQSVADGSDDAALRAFLLKPRTGRTHQLRVAMKALGSPILGDGLYAAAADAAQEERAYLHASALRIPAGHAALSEGGLAIDVILRPNAGAAFATDGFQSAWDAWFDDCHLGSGDEWFGGTPVASRGLK